MRLPETPIASLLSRKVHTESPKRIPESLKGLQKFPQSQYDLRTFLEASI